MIKLRKSPRKQNKKEKDMDNRREKIGKLEA